MARWCTIPAICMALSWAIFLDCPVSQAQQLTGNRVAAKASAKPKAKPIEVEVIRERYPNRSVRVERHVTQDNKRNYVNHGTWTRFDMQGNIIETGEYWYGKKHGKWSRWFGLESTDENGVQHPGDLPGVEEHAIADPFQGEEFKGFEKPFVAEASYVDNKLVGAWNVVDARGRTVSSWQFDQDKLHGRSVWYYPSGKPHREINFEKGIITGELLEWGPNEEVIRRDTFVNGRRLAKETKTYEDGSTRGEGMTLFARIKTEVSTDWSKGDVSFEIVGKDGADQKHGKWTFWHENGGKMSEGEYVNGKPIGQHIWWYSNGQKSVEGAFNDGKQTGQWLWWHENGLKKVEGTYAAGNQVGTWTSWDESGKVAGTRNLGNHVPRISGRPGYPARRTR